MDMELKEKFISLWKNMIEISYIFIRAIIVHHAPS